MNKKLLLQLGSLSLITTSLILTGCQPANTAPSTNKNNSNSQNNTQSNETEKTNFELAGTSWMWIQNTMKDGSTVKSNKSEEFVLTFATDDKVSSSTDCNSLGGTYKLANNKLTFSPFMQTLMYCAESQEADYVNALSPGGTINIKGEVLTISSENVSMEFTKTDAPETIETPTDESSEATTPNLAGTSWQWVNTSMNDESVTTPTKPEAFILTFAEDGKLSSKTDCNSISSTYTANQGELTFGPLAMTKMFCQGSQESVYAKALGEVQSYLVNGETLSLALRLDSGIMEFKKVN